MRGQIKFMNCLAIAMALVITILISSPPGLAVDFDRFMAAYENMEEYMFSLQGEIAEVHDFVYQKDAATFHFKEGRFLLRRLAEGRPTVAVFIGKGSVSMTVPTHVERRYLDMITGDSVVQEEFDICHIRFADDLDLKLKEAFSFRTGKLRPAEGRRIKSNQGDYNFKPLEYHGSDNYFHLLRSVFNRGSDGYFWASFNDYVFSFDPNRPEEVGVFYNREPTTSPYWAARFSRRERLAGADGDSLKVVYPTRCTQQQTTLEFGGMDGRRIIQAQSNVTVLVERDSVQFGTVAIDHRLQIDSIYCDGIKTVGQTRKGLDVVGLLLPRWYRQGDTLTLSIWYHGSNYWYIYPWVKNPSRFPHTIVASAPADYDYPLLGKGRIDETNPDQQTFKLETAFSYPQPQCMALATGYDTLVTTTSWGLPVHYLFSKLNLRGLLRDKSERDAVTVAMEFMYRHFGPPIEVEKIVIFGGGYRPWCFSGVSAVGHYKPYKEEGGFLYFAGGAVVPQWLSGMANIKSYRDKWMVKALQSYVNLVLLQEFVGDRPFNWHLNRHKNIVLDAIEKDFDTPLGSSGWNSKGIWLIHMLRNLMNATDPVPDQRFMAWLKDIFDGINTGPFSNADFQKLAEQYFGYDLDWFFKKWLYGTGIPEYRVNYSINQGDAGYYVDLDITTEGTDDDFLAPILIKVDLPNGATLKNCFVGAAPKVYRLGPYADKPKKMYFNRYLSVLAKAKTKKTD